uniref:Putative LOC101863340 [Aplysia californica] n=1 Tax=Lepeophtheirus salmonis TaxID=72036 RepID=A0A0K2TAJ9_LEPSM
MSENISSTSNVDIRPFHPDLKLRYVDEEEQEMARMFCKMGCNCKLGPQESCEKRAPCSNWFSPQEVTFRRDQSFEMATISKGYLEMYILGHFSSMNEKDEKSKLYIKGKHVCQITFSFLIKIWKSTLGRLRTHYLEKGLTLRIHKSIGNLSSNPYNRSIHERREGIKIFLENLMKEHGVSIRGSLTSHSDFKAVRFPSHWSKYIIYQKYAQSCQDSGYQRYCSKIHL